MQRHGERISLFKGDEIILEAIVSDGFLRCARHLRHSHSARLTPINSEVELGGSYTGTNDDLDVCWS